MQNIKHLRRKIQHILHPVKPRPCLKEPLVMYYIINDKDLFTINLSEMNLDEVFDPPIDPKTCEPVEGTYRFFMEKITIPAITKRITTDVVFIPKDLDKYTYARFTCLIQLENFERTFEYKEFSRKRGLWYY